MKWEEILNHSIAVDNYKHLEIRYVQEKKRFFTQVKDTIISAPSQKALEKRVDKMLETAYEQAISVGYFWRVSMPKIVKALKRGERWYILDDDGKMRRTSDDLYIYSPELFKKLEAIFQDHLKLEEIEDDLKVEWNEVLIQARKLKGI